MNSHGGWFENCKRCKPPTILQNDKLAEKLREVTKQLIENAAIDSHEPIDYNPGRLMMKRIQELFLGPLQQRFAWLFGSGHRLKVRDGVIGNEADRAACKSQIELPVVRRGYLPVNVGTCGSLT